MLKRFRFDVSTVLSNKEGESWARFNGLRHSNPGIKTQWVQTEKLLEYVLGGELYPLPMVEVVFFSSFCFSPQNGPAWYDTAQLLAAKQVVARQGLQQHNPPFELRQGGKGKRFCLTALYQLCFTLPAHFV